MSRLLICLAMSLMLFACGKPEEEPESEQFDSEEYNFNDGYYLYNGQKIYLTPVEDEYTIVFKSEDKNEVLDYLERNGWVILFNGPYENTGQNWDDFEVPDYLKCSFTAQIKGKGNIGQIPHVYFSHNAYMLETGAHVFQSNKIYVKYYDEGVYGDRLTEAWEYAQQLNIVPVSVSDLGSSKYVTFVCTNDSAGTPVELANWFCEEKGFTTAEPEFCQDPNDFWN